MGAEGDMALRARGIQQSSEALWMDHCLIFAVVEGEGGELGRALGGELGRRTFAWLLSLWGW